MIVLALDFGKLGFPDLVKRPLPQIVDECQHVGLPDECQLACLSRGYLFLRQPFPRPRRSTVPRVLKCVSQCAFDAHPRIHGRLHGDLVRGSLVRKPSHSAIKVFRILSHNREIDFRGALVLDRRFHTGKQLHGPQVNVLVQFKTQSQQDPFFQDSRFHVRMPDSPEENRVELLQLDGRGFRKNFPCSKVAVPAKIELSELHSETVRLPGRFQHLHGFACNFPTGSVARENGNLVCFFHPLLHPLGVPRLWRLPRLGRGLRVRPPEPQWLPD